MDIFSSFIRREAQGARTPDTSAGKPSGGSYQANVVEVVNQTGALSVAAFYRAVELRSNTMSQLVLQYQKKNNASHGSNYEQCTDAALRGRQINYLLQVQPNPFMTWNQLIKQAEQNRIFYGNAVIYIERDDAGFVCALWLCNNATLNPLSMTYNIKFKTLGGDRIIDSVPMSDVLHLKNTFSNDYGLTGISTLKYARQALTLAATNDKLVTETAAKGMRQKLIIQEEKQGTFGLNRADKKQLEKITSEFESDIAGKDVILLSNVASVTPISTNLQQQEISQIRQFSVAEVARYTGTPKIMLMDSANESYKTPEAATQEYLLRTIQPLAHDWEVELNAKLLGPNLYGKMRFKFDDASLMRLDPTGRANIGKVLIETGVKCVNELRADYDLPSVDGGDRHFISTNLQPVDAPAVQSSKEGGDV